MAVDFDQLPFYDVLVKDNTNKMSDVWVGSLSNFFQTLIGYLSQRGIFIPVLTTAERDAIQSPQEGQMIYTSDTTIGPPRTASLQIWQVKAGVGAWRTVTTTP